MRDKKQKTTAQKVLAWETAMPLLEAMYGEFKELSKKKPDGAVSNEKIKIVNRLLAKCREVLAKEDSLSFLDLLDEDVIPQHSDVVLMLSQYVAAMSQFRAAHYGWDGVEHDWFT